MHEGDPSTARSHYVMARGQISPNLVLYEPMKSFGQDQIQSYRSRIVERLLEFANSGRESYARQRRTMTKSLIWLGEGSPRQSEEAVRYLGELLGFTASRPDNDVGTGPDVLWHDEADNTLLAFELKN